MPHVVIPVKAQGELDSKEIEAEIKIKISIRALLVLGLLLNLISVPVATILQRFAF